jgi:hypothetical protein
MIFRLSQKLHAKIEAEALPVMPFDENLFADWSAHLFSVKRTQYVIISNTPSLYSVVLSGRGITDESSFIEHALRSIREFMEVDGQEFVYRRFVAPTSGTVHFAKALDRSVTGSMVELINQATDWLAEGETSLHEVCKELNDILLSALARDASESYRTPRQAFKTLLGDCEPVE